MDTSPPLQPATTDPSATRSGIAVERRCALIINRQSGTVSDLWDDTLEQDVLARLKSNGWEPKLFKVTGKEIEPTVKKALDGKFGAIIAGGGDGTTTSIAAMLRETDMPLGILPFGTLNLAARDLGVPLDPKEAVSSLHPGKTRK